MISEALREEEEETNGWMGKVGRAGQQWECGTELIREKGIEGRQLNWRKKESF